MGKTPMSIGVPFTVSEVVFAGAVGVYFLKTPRFVWLIPVSESRAVQPLAVGTRGEAGVAL